jgi:D-alanine--poly(phosphoribitol) ligase subunit 1
MLQQISDRILHTPDKIALLNDDGPCTFGNLGARCQGIINSISTVSAGAALIYGHKEVDTVATMLACAFTGRPFVFVDIANPFPRLVQIARTSQARVIISCRPLPGQVDGQMVDTRSISPHTLAAPKLENNDRGIFYIAFTSGSTGSPKGVQVGYDNFSWFYSWYGPLLQSCRGTGAHVNHAPLSFDMGMLDLWPPLALGRSVILLDHRHNALPRANLHTLSGSPNIVPGTWFSTPTFLTMMCSEAGFRESTLPWMRTFFVGGEQVPRSLIARLLERFPAAEIWHAYGPTEVTCMTHCLRLTKSDLEGSGPLPLGRALGPNEIRLVGQDGQQVAMGQSGEIELSGPQVAYGYLPEHHPENHLFGTRKHQHFYRTGDYGVVDRKSNLTLRGRLDGQVKWNGNRLEIGEIERVAMDGPDVCQATVVPVAHDGRLLDLILFVEMRPDDDTRRSTFLQHLNGALPGYMRPRSIRFVDQLPLTLHGKVDRRRLSGTLPQLDSAGARVGPQSG